VIRLLCVGKQKEPHYAEAAGEYLKRLSRYARTEVVELRECTDKNPQVAKRKEAALIVERLIDSYTVVLDRGGKQTTSEEFSEILKKPDVTFVIGGPDGLAREVLDEADLVLSLSKMTLPHQLARVILLEQIYRGHTILKNEKYHK
jgi:23S rRNA (pseudouridine1915-N3)-methyltransferase